MENHWNMQYYGADWKKLPAMQNPESLKYQILSSIKQQNTTQTLPATVLNHYVHESSSGTKPVTCTTKLQNLDLWQQFHKYDTEMVITKTGRRMFPSLRIALTEMDPALSYCVMIEMALTTNTRYKFNGKTWTAAGAAEPQSYQRFYLHPDSPASGAHWMEQPISFNKIKLTNNQLDKYGHIVLTSMHQYLPRIHIIQTSNAHQDLSLCPRIIIPLVETKFIAVTAYQNENITKLKIDNNPFAKGFRDTGLAKTKRKANTASPVSNELSDNDESPQKRSSPSSLSGSTVSDDNLDVCNDDDQPICKEPIQQEIIPYYHQYHPQLTSNLALITPYYYSYPMPYFYDFRNDSPQDLSLKGNETRKKDFSIQSILSR